MELVKTRIQIQEQLITNGARLYKGPTDCARQIWRAEGMRGIFRGLNITIAREIPAFGLYFSSYEAMTRRGDATKPISTVHMMTAGGCAGMCSWLFTYPIDFVKSRLQVDGLAGIRVYSGIWNCIAKTYQDEGARGFFRGMSSTLIRSFPVNAVTFSVVTWILECSTPHSNETSNVTYQNASSLMQQHQQQESLVVQDQPVNRPQQHEAIFVAEWQHFGLSHLGLAGVASIGLSPVRNYAIHCRCSDWIGNALAMTSFSHFHQVPQLSSVGCGSSRVSPIDLMTVNSDPSSAPPPPLGHCSECRESEEIKIKHNNMQTTSSCPVCKNPSHVEVINGPRALTA